MTSSRPSTVNPATAPSARTAPISGPFESRAIWSTSSSSVPVTVTVELRLR